jgi:hypothetical protein
LELQKQRQRVAKLQPQRGSLCALLIDWRGIGVGIVGFVGGRCSVRKDDRGSVTCKKDVPRFWVQRSVDYKAGERKRKCG